MILCFMEEQFVQIPRTLIKSKNPLSVLTYAIIDNHKTTFPFGTCVDKPVAFISYNKMVEKYGVNKSSTIKCVDSLKEQGYIDYTQEDSGRYNASMNKNEVFNKYSFPLITPIYKNNKIIDNKIKIPYVEIPSSVLVSELSSKEKGVLIMLYLLTIDTYDIILTEEEMAAELGMTVRTLKKYIKLFISKNYLYKNRYYGFRKKKDVVMTNIIMD